MLADAQNSLERHFASLSSSRAEHRYPVYAFEHGLTPEEIHAVKAALEAQLRKYSRPLHEYWLLWNVLATEVGYTYDGDEYWCSFVGDFPAWRDHGDRDLMRDWFKKFAQRFAGFSPSGRWADHFSIIAWPISHSILPKYLQGHFAAHLHDIRYEVAQYCDAGISQLGDLIKRRYFGESSRFRDFLQQTELTACLVLALRDEDLPQEVSPIDRKTLGRIVADLEQHQAMRHQLGEARRVLRAARFSSSRSLTGALSSPSSQITPTEAARVPGPKLVGVISSSGSCKLGIAMPDFASILRNANISLGDIDTFDIRFTGGDDRWHPGRSLFAHSGRRMPIGGQIALDSAFLEIRGGNSSLRSALIPYLKLQGRFPLLLRIHEDGIGRQVSGNHVRSDKRYLIISDGAISGRVTDGLQLLPLECGTPHLFAHELTTPCVFNDQHVEALKALNFGHDLRIRVEPVGLLPRRYGENTSSWLPDEEIILSLSADFSVQEFIVSVDDEPIQRISATQTPNVLVSMGTLPVGVHTATLTASGTSLGQKIEPEHFVFQVRSPELWFEGAKRQSGVKSILHPASASFDELLAGEATLTITGPKGRSAKVILRICDEQGVDLSPRTLGTGELPMDGSKVAHLLNRLEDDSLLSRIESAPRVDIDVVADELGHDRISFHQAVMPLRWKLEHRGRSLLLRLVDEAGAGSAVVIRRYDVQTPDQGVDVEFESCYAGISMASGAALFVARYQGQRYAAAVSLRETVNSLADIGAPVQLTPSKHFANRQIALLLVHHHRWHSARPLGPLSIVHKSRVLATLALQICRELCPGTWADRLKRCLTARADEKRWLYEQMRSDVGGSPGFSIEIADSAVQCTTLNAFEGHFIQKVHAYRVSPDPLLPMLAFALALRPEDVRFDRWKVDQQRVRALMNNPILVRGAYFAKLSWDMKALEARGRA